VAIRIRDFGEQDFEVLWKIDQLCFAPGIAYSHGALDFYITKRNTFTLIAEYTAVQEKPEFPQGIAGFIVAEVNRRSGHIITIDVVPKARRLKIGSMLMEGAEARLRLGNCIAITLETAVDNKSALAFYKKHGYFVVKTIPRYYANGVDAFILTKQLAARQVVG